jgi:predicted signal transduction protein with EAL and GGDEF domain
MANRLRNSARRSDTLARFGGDEFVILCDRVAAPEDARSAAERVIREINRPFAVAGSVVHVSANVGIAATSDRLTQAPDLVRDADIAMYQAKERERNGGRYQLFDSDLRQHAINRFKSEAELRLALTEGQFRVYYRPLHNLSKGELHGVEALVRWQHPTRGLLVPADFLAVAAQCDIIVTLSEWVLDEACSQLTLWNAARTTAAPLTMAVNVSARQLANHSLVSAVAAALHKHEIPPHLLCLEITETAPLEEAVSSPEVFIALRALGVRLALDDFGTGYSSLAHLRRFPVDIIKIDQEFVRELSPAGGDMAIVAAITAMAHALGMVTVGEGVETPAQLAQLREIGCDAGRATCWRDRCPPPNLTRSSRTRSRSSRYDATSRRGNRRRHRRNPTSTRPDAQRLTVPAGNPVKGNVAARVRVNVATWHAPQLMANEYSPGGAEWVAASGSD